MDNNGIRDWVVICMLILMLCLTFSIREAYQRIERIEKTQIWLIKLLPALAAEAERSGTK